MSTNTAVMPADKIGKGKKEKSNILVTVLLLLGCVMILFPLYMTIVIALKSPSEMTNDVAGALSFPKSFSISNFREAMKVTNFWSSLTNSIIITGASILISLVIHSMAGYALGRAMNRFKKFKVIYYYIVSGMFVPFAILMMPLVKETATIGIDNMFGVIVLYVVFLFARYKKPLRRLITRVEDFFIDHAVLIFFIIIPGIFALGSLYLNIFKPNGFNSYSFYFWDFVHLDMVKDYIFIHSNWLDNILNVLRWLAVIMLLATAKKKEDLFLKDFIIMMLKSCMKSFGIIV